VESAKISGVPKSKPENPKLSGLIFHILRCTKPLQKLISKLYPEVL